MTLDLQCTDFLRDNTAYVAHKARRKKISLVFVTARNGGSAPVELQLSQAHLGMNDTPVQAMQPDAVYRRLSEFTWDFLLYAVLDFHPVMAALDLTLCASGPLLNWRLRRRLGLLNNRELHVEPGQSCTALVAFPRALRPGDRLIVPAVAAGAAPAGIECPISSHASAEMVVGAAG